MKLIRRFLVVIVVMFVPSVWGCSSSSSPQGPFGGPIDGGALASHCGTENDGGPKVTTVDPAACHPDSGMQGQVDGSAGTTAEYGPTMYNQEGDDDDCKYRVKFTVSPVARNQDVTFVVTPNYKVSGAPLTGAQPYVEAFLSDMHPAPNSNSKTTESPAGVYSIGPIRFDAPGDWTVRFHFAPMCVDQEESAHGHAAFFIRVP